MSANSNLFRMTIDIPADDHKRLKALAAVLGKSMREIVSEWIHGKLSSEIVPNSKTRKVMDDIKKGKRLVKSKNIQEMFRELGI